jgi:L,D-transpeptidase YbiS
MPVVEPAVKPGVKRTAGAEWVVRAAVGAVAALLGTAAAGTGYHASPFPVEPVAVPQQASPEPKALSKREEERRHRSLVARLERQRPQGVHVIIDQTHNRLYLRRGEEQLLQAVCSSGSGMVLREHDGRRTWVFDTPRGVFHIHRKVRDPVWTKPDWAFVEEGRPIPTDPSERVERGVLGDYACYFGDGYLIHGTLYTRLLGRSTSHGCIRLGDDDLREVYQAVSVGTPVYIY